MKRVAVVTGTRADYGILNPVLRSIEAYQEQSLSLVVTGMHLSEEFGYTVREIEKDGFTIDARVDMMPGNDRLEAMAESVGRGIIGLSQTWETLKPDVILVLGDRVEALAAAISGAYMNIPIAHIHGGDSSKGGLDEYARHAITKFAHIHFPATQKSAERIIKMGEDKWRVHMVGSPALDVILNEPLMPQESTIKKFGVDSSKPLVLMVQHPVTTAAEKAGQQMTETLEAVTATGHPVILVYPNADAGGRRMIEILKDYEKRYTSIKALKSLPRREYLGLMKVASVLVGNSSSGMIDAPSFGLPVVNIGSRQDGRERGNNVINVGHNREEITTAIIRALEDSDFLDEVKRGHNPYGDGKASSRIIKILSGIENTPRLLQKQIAY
ncbi:MAG: UDP-N-acetylglucosamine 2-epimerase [Dehalococcoidales bacterium]|jgi:UDP-N-acetylglucosamine 2-epimerase (non-hydrolysing)/GDP/UDP-N,N'-diacetylbacillosamine 2-epimerase (hydrolysing)|nr:UDP-N-acetylglucosamine 2-epimerase [Dehalococcoidales bacterium]